MRFPIVFHPEVEGEVDEAYGWYERQRKGLGEDFLVAVEETLLQVRTLPLAHPTIYRNVRRAAPKRFPYGVFYRVHSDRIEIVSVLHSRQDAQRWKSRL
jgi:toxin ParE1/3/4